MSAEAPEAIQSLEARLEVESRTTWSLLCYLADLRYALGDDGRRMQAELLDYARALVAVADPAHVARLETTIREQREEANHV